MLPEKARLMLTQADNITQEREADYNNKKVPDLLLSCNKSKIEDWREKKSIEKTKKIRPGLLK